MKHYTPPLFELCMITGMDEVIRTSRLVQKSSGSGNNWDVASAIAEQQD